MNTIEALMDREIADCINVNISKGFSMKSC